MVEKNNDITSDPAALSKTENNNVAADAATNPAATPPNKSDIKGLAFHFFEAYYTKLSDHPDDIGTFYGEDSIYVQDDVEEVGRENIQIAIASMNFGGCKARFFSLKATPAIGDSKVFQVCGELMLKGQPTPRRFSQTIVLSCAPPNVLYVKSNIFQWLDVIFPMNGSEKVYFVSTPHSGQPVENGGGPPMAIATMTGEKPLLNGGNHVGKEQHLPAVSKTPLKNESTVIISGGPPPGLEKMAAPPPSIAQMEMNNNNKTTSEKAPPTMNGLSMDNNFVKQTDVIGGGNNDESAIVQPSQPKLRGRGMEQQQDKEENITNDTKTEDKKEHHPMVADSEQQKHHQHHHHPKSTEPKSWNKVVSGGQNKFQQQMENNKTNMANNNAQPKKSPPAQTTHQLPPHSNEHPPKNNQQQSEENTPTPPPAQTAPVKQQQQQFNHPQQQQQHQFHSSSPQDEQQQPTQQQQPLTAIVKPRADWPYRIYFNNLDKPAKFVDNKVGQQELKREIMAITQGVEFVAIKPNSLRSSYQFAFGFIDFTSTEDMQAVYDAAQKAGDKTRLKVSIPHFQFDGHLALTSEKTNNLGGNNGNVGGGTSFGGGNFYGRQQQHGGGHHHHQQAYRPQRTDKQQQPKAAAAMAKEQQ